MNDPWEIAIVGGTGGMGKVFAKELKTYTQVTIISRSLEKVKRISETLGVQGGVLKDCQSADITIVSVPIENTFETCQKLLNILKPALVNDLIAACAPGPGLFCPVDALILT